MAIANESSQPNTPQPSKPESGDTCPKCGGVLVPTHWLASVGEYPVKEVVKVPGGCCAACNYLHFEYDPHAKAGKP